MSGDIWLGEIMGCISSLKKGSNSWRLLWKLLEGVAWHICQERNRRWMKSGFKQVDVVISEFLKDCKLCFDVKSIPPDVGVLEVNVMRQWLL